MGEKINNIVVEVLNPEHGAKVIQAFQDLGVDTSEYLGSPSVMYRYYGILDERFGSYNIADVKYYGPKILTLEELQAMNTKSEKTFPRWMMVSQDNKSFYKKYVLNQLSDKRFAASIGYSSSGEVCESGFFGVSTWIYAKEIEEPKTLELTLKQVAEKFGVDTVKIVEDKSK